jgi:dihydroflavonol-4-reductase
VLRTNYPENVIRDRQTTYLITGGTGFLGRHVLEALRRIASDVRLVVLARSAKSWESQPWCQTLTDVEVVTGPLFPTDSWKNDPRLARLDGIFHLAGEVKHTRANTRDMFRANVEGTSSMVRLAAEKKCRLVFVSTSGTVSCSPLPGHGASEEAPYCEDVVRNWPYYVSKIRAEKEARTLARDLGVQLIVFRPPALLGPGDHRYRSTASVLRVLQQRLPFILNGGMHFVDVRDAAEAMIRAMAHHKPKPVYHLAGTVCTLDDFFRAIARAANLKPSWTILPAQLLWYISKLNEISGFRFRIIPDPVLIEMARHHWDLRSRHAEVDLGYRSRPAEQTIAETVSWMLLNHPDVGKRSGTRLQQLTADGADAVRTAS